MDVRDDKPDLTGTPLDLAEVRVDNVSWSEARSEDEIREKPRVEANLEPVEEEVSSAEDPEVDELREGSSAAKSDQAMSSENITHDDLESVTIEEESYRPDDTMESQDELGTERAKMAAALSPCRLRPAQYVADTVHLLGFGKTKIEFKYSAGNKQEDGMDGQALMGQRVKWIYKL